jgi:hypothetical protein
MVTVFTNYRRRILFLQLWRPSHRKMLADYGINDWVHLPATLKSHESRSGHMKLLSTVGTSRIKMQRRKNIWQFKTIVDSEIIRALEIFSDPKSSNIYNNAECLGLVHLLETIQTYSIREPHFQSRINTALLEKRIYCNNGGKC